MAPEPVYTAEQVDAVVRELGDHPEAFEHAQAVVTHAAPGLQRVLNDALAQGGWFGDAHEAQVAAAAATDDPADRLAAVRTLIADETRLGMLVGVAVGFELHRRLLTSTDDEES